MVFNSVTIEVSLISSSLLDKTSVGSGGGSAASTTSISPVSLIKDGVCIMLKFTFNNSNIYDTDHINHFNFKERK